MGGRLHKLSAIEVKKLTKPGRYGDGGNLWLNVTDVGTKSWIFRYMISGKVRSMGMGSYPDISLADARERATTLRIQLNDGIDPLLAKQEKVATTKAFHAKARDFDWCAREYIAAFKSSWKSDKSEQQWQNTLTTYASPVIGKMDVRQIELDHILQVLQPIWHTIPETAGRVRGRIEKILDWATVKGHRSGDNPARWDGNIETILPKRNKVATVEHHPSLPHAQIRDFVGKLHKKGGVGARAVEFTILTAARSGEVRGATWNEFDLDAKIWTVPASRMKMKKEHRVPLSARAVKIIKEMQAIRSSDLVFVGAKKDTPLSDMSLTKVIRDMHEDKIKAGGKGWIDPKTGNRITVHGFRSTFRTWASEKTEYPREMAELAIAHRVGTEVEQAYFRTDMIQKRLKMMEDWSAYCGL